MRAIGKLGVVVAMGCLLVAGGAAAESPALQDNRAARASAGDPGGVQNAYVALDAMNVHLGAAARDYVAAVQQHCGVVLTAQGLMERVTLDRQDPAFEGMMRAHEMGTPSRSDRYAGQVRC